MSLFSLLSYARYPIAITSGIVGSLSGLLYWKQSELIYPRALPPGSRTEVPRPSDIPQAGLTDITEEIRIPTPDGELLHSFLIRPRRKSPASNVTVIMFHGNAGNIGHRLPVAAYLKDLVDCNILMMEYRGYGLSTGSPDEKGINMDTRATLDWIRATPELRDTKIVVYGQSIGGAVAIQMVARNLHANEITALILENTFLSIRKMIPCVIPAAKYIAPLCHQVWPSEETIPKINHIPILFLSGLKDEIVPCSQMSRLHSISTSPNKVFKTFPGGDHNETIMCDGYFEAIQDFIEQNVIKSKR